MKKFNGARVRLTERTAFVALPREAWEPVLGGCCCRYCSDDRRTNAESFWDTLAVPIGPAPKDGYALNRAYTVHMPEIHDTQPKRDSE